MAQIDLGKVSVTPKGEWNQNEAYEFLDIVTHGGSSYLAAEDIPAGSPLSAWLLLAEKGGTGNGIESVELISTSGSEKTYRITFTDGNTFEYVVTDGEVTEEELTAALAPKADKTALAASKHQVEVIKGAALGKLWTTSTDETAAYAKSVPAGALAVEVEKMEGKSIVRNNKAIIRKDKELSTLTFGTRGEDGLAHISGKLTSTRVQISSSSSIPFTEGHVYLIRVFGDDFPQVKLTRTGTKIGTAVNGLLLYTAPSSSTGSSIGMLSDSGDVLFDGDYGLMLVDLTVMFGADVAATIATPEDAFALGCPREMAATDPGTLVHAEVDKVITAKNGVQTAELNIPPAIRALPGYGQSVVGGDANTVDFVAQTYTERGHYVEGEWVAEGVPIITDISGLLEGVDTMLDAEGGGTVTFHQSSTEIPVPNTTTAYINIAPADERGIPSYYYADDYLPGRIAEIHAHDETCALHGDGFIWITDTHYSREGDPTPDNMGYSPLLIEKIVRETSVNRVVFGGDVMTDFTEDKDEAKTEFRANRFRYPADPVEYYQIRGNHDYNGIGSSPDTQRLTAAESYAVLSKDLESRAHVLDRSVYYFDNEFQHIRTFCVSCAYSYAIPSASQPLLYAAFADVPDGWSVLVLSHIGTHWDSGSSSVVVMPEFENVAAALDALKAGTSFTYSGVTYDYSDTDVTVIGVISGHTHNDYDILTSGGIHIISTACDKFTQPSHSGGSRTRHTISEQCFDVVQIDTDQKKIYMTRIGAGEDREVSYE